MLAGRSTERAYVRAALDGAREGRGQAVLLQGPPGIGKTALLDDAVAQAAGFRVLRAHGVESESRLAFAGLSDLLRPVLDCLARVPGAQRAALQAALALGPPAVPDRFAAYAATLSLLGAVAADGPVLIAVDDLHWVDHPTHEALIFCARRIEDEPIAILASSRERPPERAELEGARELELAPLDDRSARSLLDSQTASAGLAASVAEEVLALAQGNPLALVELPRALSPDERAGRVALPRPLRAGEALARAYRRRVEALEPGARRALVLAAASGDGALAPLVSALADTGRGPGDLAEAEAIGFLLIDGDAVRLRHAVLRSVVLELADPGELRAAHRALAAALDPDRDAEARAWHLAEAAIGPDAEAASALEDVGARAARRTGYTAAAAALERAAALSSSRDERARRLLAAGIAAQHGGILERSVQLLAAAARESTDPAMSADIGHLRGLMSMWLGPVPAGAAILVEEADRAAAAVPDKAALMLADAVVGHSLAAQTLSALATSRRGLALALAAEEGPLPISMALVGWALTLHGERRGAIACLSPLDRIADAVDPVSPVGQLVGLTSLCHLWLDQYEVAAARLGPWLDGARTTGSVAYTAHALVIASELRLRLGRLGAARAGALEAVRLLDESGQRSVLGYAQGLLAQAQAAMGAEAECAEASARAEELADRMGTDSGRFLAAAARASSHLARGEPEAALEHLRWIEDGYRRRALGEPNLLQWQPDMIEAYVRLGRVDDARRAVATLAEQAFRGGGRWARAAACRGRGMIDPDFDRHFGQALALHAQSDAPFERARTQLAYGARLRRARRRAEAREQVEPALATFEELGARPWARQAREEIAAAGSGLRRRATRAADELSPRELQVATAVAEGLTNREAAARLFLSEKTIERHLGSVYRKLGLRSRTELARRFARGSPGAAHRLSRRPSPPSPSRT